MKTILTSFAVISCILPPLILRYYCDLTPQQYDLVAIGIFVGALVTATVLISTYCILEDNE